jgi:hypothetical protein
VSTRKNLLRIQQNIKSIENSVENLILTSESALLLKLYHGENLRLCEAKDKIRQFLGKIRTKFKNPEYLVLSMMDNQAPVHRVLIAGIDAEPEQLSKIWGDVCEIEVLQREDAFKQAVFMGEFYEEAAFNLGATRQNSKKQKSKLFHRSRGALLQAA